MDAVPADPMLDQLRRVCGQGVTTLPATGAGLSVMGTDKQFSMLTATDPTSERLEELQFVLGEGPCVEAGLTRRPVLVPDLDADGVSRWPAYASAVLQAGIGAVFAFPLQVGATQLGVMDFFRSSPGHLSSAELSRAYALADEAIGILLGGTADTSLTGPAELFQAQGMVMVQIAGTLTEAMSRIRAHAYAENRRLIDVVNDIVERKLQFDRDE
jgi:GAF domain-containing protein